MMTHPPSAPVLVAVGLCVALSAGGAGAYDGFIAPINEIPLTSPLLPSARALGMGGVALAVADDSSALSTNPAALARMRRVELSGGLSKATDDLGGTAFGSEFGTSLSRTDFSSLRFAYPFPTFRGSFVMALGCERVYGFDDDFLAAYEDTITWEESEGEYLTGPWAQIEDEIAEGDIYAWTLAAAIDASASVSLGAAVSYWSGDYSRSFAWKVDDTNGLSDAYDSYELAVRSDANVSGFRMKLGSLFYITEGLAAALVVDCPVTLTFEGSERVTEAYNGVQEGSEVTYFTDNITLPFSFEAGVAYNPTDLVVLAADVSYTDWSEMTYEGFLYLDDPSERRAAYEATTDCRIGVEFTVPSWPLRLRGGYMTRPIAYRGLDIDSDRSYFTLGVGVLFDTVLAIDLAWLRGAYERSGPDYDYSEEVTDTAFVLEAAYRF